MPQIGGSFSREESILYGLYWHELLRNPTWSNRRVESNRFEDDFHVNHRISIDLNMPRIRSLATDLEATIIGHQSTQGDLQSTKGLYAYVPLVLLDKNPELELDIQYGGTDVASAVPSDTSSSISFGYFMAWQYLNNTYSHPTKKVEDLIHKIISNPDGIDTLVSVLEFITITQSATNAANALGLELDQPDVEYISHIIENDESFDLLLDLASRRFLIIPIDLNLDFLVIKICRRLEVPPSGIRQALAMLGITPLKFLIPADGIGAAGREHTRIHAPDESTILSASLIVDNSSSREVAITTSQQMTMRIDRSTAVCYTNGLEKGPYNIEVKIAPKFWVFFGPALICSLLLVLFSRFGFALESKCHLLTQNLTNTGPGSTEAAVTVLAVIPTAFAAFIVQRSEHGIVRRIHATPRFILLAPALFMLVSAAAIAAPIPNGDGHDLVLNLLLATFCSSSISFALFLIVTISTIIRISIKKIREFK